MNITNEIITPDENYSLFEKYKIVFDELKKILDYDEKVIKLEFDKDIIFLHPLFLIHFYNLYEFILKKKIDKKILLDFRNLNENLQAWTLTYLAQYIDYQIIKLENNSHNFQKNIYSNYKEKIIIFYTIKKYESSSLTKMQSYNFLPITKITSITNINMDEDYLCFQDNENLKHFYYLSLQLETEEKGIYRNKSDKVWTNIFETYLNIAKDKSDSIYAFKNILFECVDNIQKHTQNDEKKANGYIAFYKNTHNKLNEFIVCDDYEKGFIETYLEVLKKEKDRLINICNEKYFSTSIEVEKEELTKIISNYEEDIDILNTNTSENDIKILENLFCLNEIPKMHQAGRIIMHFGIPTLIKLLNKLNTSTNKLEIYLHREERSYYILYKNGKAEIKQLLDNSVKGTYIYLSFDFDSKIENNEIQNYTIQDSKNLKTVFESREKIMKDISKFELIDLNNLDLQNSLNKTISNIYIEYNNENVSDFLRKIYLLSYKNNFSNVLIYNFPIKLYKNYINLLIDILYPNNEINYEKQTFIAFLNCDYPQAIIIGGKDKNELSFINSTLDSNYNYYKTNILVWQGNKELIINNNFFNTIDNKSHFLPFELFLKTRKDNPIFMEMIDNFLDSKNGYLDIHLDTKDGFHIKKFYNFKIIFENSFWLNKIAFYLASKIDLNYNDIIFVGSWYYSSQIISLTKHLINNENNHFIIYDYKKDFERFEKFVKKEENKNKIFLFFSPIILTGKRLEKYFLEDLKKELYCCIQICHDKMYENNHNYKYFLKKDISYEVERAENCKFCFIEDNPLYELDENSLNVKDFYLENYESKLEVEHINNISWENSIYFGHVHRGNNHYLYYTKTINFLKNNKLIIKNFLDNFKKKEKEISIIFAPINETNHDFITMVDNIVFNNNSRIHYFDIKNKEQNLNNLYELKELYKVTESFKFYFVDDEISSGVTLEHFHTILRYITNNNQIKFDSIFTLIDRTSKELNSLSNYYNNLFSFKKLPIKPIKTNQEKCYLCEREKYFTNLTISSSLIFIKEQFRKGIKKLNNKNATIIEYKDFSMIENIKNYLKLFSVEFVYMNLNKFNELKDVQSQLDNFISLVKEYYKFLYNDDEKVDCLMKFISMEIKIAFIKALSFPKILFFKNIRKIIHSYILNELKVKKNELFSIDREVHGLKLIKNNNIEVCKIFNTEEIENLKFYFPNSDLEKYYSNKTNIDYLNFLFITSAYLKINFILSDELIEFYYLLTLKIKEKELPFELMHKYPVAVKMLIFNNISKSKYFSNQMKIFISNKRLDFKFSQNYSLIYPLYIENTEDIIYLKKTLKNDLIGNSYNEDDILILKNSLTKLLNLESKNIKLYVNTSMDLKNPTLLDLFSNDFYIKEFDSIECILFSGAKRDKNTDAGKIKLELNTETKYKYNIWSNYFVENGNDSKTYVRLTIVDKKNIASENNIYIPSSLVVLNHTKGINNHLQYTKKLLFIQEEIENFIKSKNLIKTLIEKNQKFTLENQELSMYKKLLGNIRHSNKSLYSQICDYVCDNKNNEQLLILYNFTASTEYKNLANFLEQKKQNNYENSIKNVLEDSFLDEVKKYFESLKIIKKKNFTINIENLIEEDFYLRLTDKVITAIFFELIDNTYTNRKNDYDQIEVKFKTINNILYIISFGTKKVPKNNIDRLFDLDYTTTGSGSGLYFIKKILKLNDISIEYLDNTDENIQIYQNTTFILKIKKEN